MLHNREKFLWTDALRLTLIKEIKRRPLIWSSNSNNFNGMTDKVAYQITKKLHEVSTGICELTVNHVKDEWKAISGECVRVLDVNSELTQTESSIWRFSYVLKFMLYAVTHTEEGNAYVLLYVNKLKIFCVVGESDIVGVLWPFSNVSVQIKGKVERAMIIKVGRRNVMIAKCKHVSTSINSFVITNDKLTESQMLPNKVAIQPVQYSGSLMRKDDQIVYHDSGTYSDRDDSVKNAPLSLRMPDVGESKPFSALQLLLQNRTSPKQPLFYGVPSSALTHIDFELYKKPTQLLPQSQPSASCNRPVPQPSVRVPLAEKRIDTDPTFPLEYSGVPIRITKQIEHLSYRWGPLLRCLTNMRFEADGLRRMAVAIKRNIEKNLKIIMTCFAESDFAKLASQAHSGLSIPSRYIAYEKGMKSVLVQTDEAFSKEDNFVYIGKVYDDEVYRYCPREIVHHLVATSSHPTAFVRRLARHIFTREEISMLFSENVNMSQMERIRWMEIITSICYPRKKLSSMHKSCIQALSGLADYENLLLELEKENHSIDSSEEDSVPAKRIRSDDACSSTYEQRNEKRKLQDYLLPQTLSRIKRQQPNAEGFAVKVAILLYTGDDDIQKPCKQKRDQAKLIWLKEKVQEFYPMDTVRNVSYQWSRCLDALDTHANKLRNMPFDEYDSSDEFEY
ncbi:hypothetical protein ACH3XW_10435 [Acanthocheilonema viteae]|uniref:MADF domain-containing protein n=1 Tax=Acanthocheilonema viteae TaxID=6277 RepID=A0A498SDW2_ACAVI|nr:unnamed protein product [Acanthocheilonema viteae]